jgi:alpha-tubulin suppressor-like RCC1 family protein
LDTIQVHFFANRTHTIGGVNDNVSFFDIMGGEARPAKTKKPREDPKLCELSAVLPTLITQKITRVVAGKDFTFAITEKGTAYSFGRNNYGQLALGSHEDCNEPMLIHFFEGNRVNDIVAGGAHAHAVLLDNEVYSWGSNERGQLGLSSLFEEVCDFAVPQQINAIIEMRIKKITTGFNHSMVLTRKYCGMLLTR